MKRDFAVFDGKEIAAEILARSPSIALRLIGDCGAWRTVYITQNIENYGYSVDDFLSGRKSWLDLVHPDDREDLVNLLTGFDEMGNDQFNIVYRIITTDGSPVWVSDSRVVVRNDDGGVSHCDSLITDYTETKQHIESIGEHYRQQAVMNRILQGLHNANLDEALQIILDDSGSYLNLSRVVLFRDEPDHLSATVRHEWRNRGIPSVSASGTCVLDYASDIPEISRDLDRQGFCLVPTGEIPPGSAKALGQQDITAAAYFAITIGEERFGILAFEECQRPREWNRETVRFLENVSSLVSPVIVRRRNEIVIQSLALTDQLTGLNNRHHLERFLNAAVDAARDRGEHGYVLFIDMDDFKVVNDAYGHDYGDTILREVAAFLVSSFGDERCIFRFGGDEFVIVVEPARAGEINAMIEALLLRARQPWAIDERPFYCTLSIGVVRFPELDEDSREIIKNADIAMYRAKKAGKNNYVFFSSQLDDDSLARLEIERAMRQAIDQEFCGFTILYQPLVDKERRIIGAEALVRWSLPDGSSLAPMKFIPLAEYLGLVIPIGEFVLRSAAGLCRRLNQIRPDFFVTVNVSMRQFKQHDFIEKTIDILDREGVNHANIVFEITEGMAIHDVQRMRHLATELNNRGIRMAMDDFGTGYSSLGNLRDLPIDVVKIDKSFIQEVTTDSYSKSFIRFISDLVHSMGRRVCVEGVETEEHWSYCLECNIDYMQGYHMSRPLGENELFAAIEGNDAGGLPGSPIPPS